jgi:hypothetical protein
MKKSIGIGLAALFLSATAAAETQHGVTVYPGAKADAETAAQLKKSMNINAHTYRTSDSVEKVSQFYRSQKLKEMPGADKQQAGFSADGVNVTVQNPWLDMKSGKINNDTLISIVKRK